MWGGMKKIVCARVVDLYGRGKKVVCLSDFVLLTSELRGHFTLMCSMNTVSVSSSFWRSLHG